MHIAGSHLLHLYKPCVRGIQETLSYLCKCQWATVDTRWLRGGVASLVRAHEGGRGVAVEGRLITHICIAVVSKEHGQR